MPSCPQHRTPQPEGETVQTIVLASVPAVITAIGTVVAAWISRRGQPPQGSQVDRGTDG